jgi:hypothetical protein
MLLLLLLATCYCCHVAWQQQQHSSSQEAGSYPAVAGTASAHLIDALSDCFEPMPVRGPDFRLWGLLLLL